MQCSVLRFNHFYNHWQHAMILFCFHHFHKQWQYTMFSVSIISINKDYIQCSPFPSFPQTMTTCNVLCSFSIISTNTENIQYSLFCFHHFHNHWQHTIFSVLFPSFPQTLTTYNVLCSVSIISTNTDNIQYSLFCFYHHHKLWQHWIFFFILFPLFQDHRMHVVSSVLFGPSPPSQTANHALCFLPTISIATDSMSFSLFCFHYFHYHRQYIMLSVLFPLFPPPQTVHHALCSVSTISTTQTVHHALCSVSTISTTQTVHHALCSVSTISTTQTAYHARVLSFPWAVPFSWARYSPPALTWPRSDRIFPGASRCRSAIAAFIVLTWARQKMRVFPTFSVLH